MTKDEILATVHRAHQGYDREASHLAFDEIVTAVLTYIAEGGEDPAGVAQAMLQHESPTEWGWYA